MSSNSSNSRSKAETVYESRNNQTQEPRQPRTRHRPRGPRQNSRNNQTRGPRNNQTRAPRNNKSQGKSIYLKGSNVSETGRFQTKINEIKTACLDKEDTAPCKGQLWRATGDLDFAKMALKNYKYHHVTEKDAENKSKHPEGPGCLADNPLSQLRRSLINKHGDKNWQKHWPPNTLPPPDMKNASIDILGCHDAIEPSEYSKRLKRGTVCLKSRIRGLAGLPPKAGGKNLIQTHLPPLGLAYEIARGCATKTLSPEKLDEWDAEIFDTINKTGDIVSRPALKEAISRQIQDVWKKPKAITLNNGIPKTPKCMGWKNETKVCRANSFKFK